MTLGEKLQELRKENHMSQEKLAPLLNVSRQAISKWELNESVPDTDKLLAICKLFDVSADYLLDDIIVTKRKRLQQTEAEDHTEHRDNNRPKDSEHPPYKKESSLTGHTLSTFVRRKGYLAGIIAGIYWKKKGETSSPSKSNLS